ncbi:DUF2066 domain-containing protein [Pseudaeromonas sp. ZJS20]|uniref:DUF2066 domain-containing protein n=1 Tax=Pseudaeromonas aegiceratis TaxID=3153928 RepID=UPI00390C52CF
MNRILVLLLSLLSFTVLANDALYRVQVPAQGVPLLDAQRQALGQVITRLSGLQDPLSAPALAAPLQAGLADLIQEYSYQEGTAGREMDVLFKPDAVKQLLAQAKLPVWESPRPKVLFWLVNDDRLLPDEDKAGWSARFALQGQRWAIPVRFPLMDLDDIELAKPELVTQGMLAPLLKASGRYEADALVLGRLYQKDDIWWLDWTLHTTVNKGTALGSGRAKGDPETLVNQMMSGLLAYFVDTYGQGASAPAAVSDEQTALTPGDGSQIQLVVDGLNQLADLLAARSALEATQALQGLNVASMAGDSVTFSASLAGDAGKLRDALRLDHRFMPVADPNQPFHYQWQGQ